MLRILIWLAMVVVWSASAWAQDTSAILGKTIDYVVEGKRTTGERAAATTTIGQSTRKIRITKDGRVFLTVKSGLGGEAGSIFKLNQTVNLVSRSEAIFPGDTAEFSISSYVVTVTFRNALLTWTGNVKGVNKSDKSNCVNHASTVVAFSPDLTTCSVKSAVVTERCGPPSNSYYHGEVVRTVSCTVSSD